MKLTKRNYFSQKANMEFMSVSQFKEFNRCPASAMAELKGEYKREETISLLMGSYIDAYFEGDRSFEKFKKEHLEIFKKDGTLKSEYIHVNNIIKRIERDPLFMEYISGKQQVIMTGTICGVAVKTKIDSLHPDKIVDFKLMKDFFDIWVEEKGERLPWFEAWDYPLQGAVYQEIVYQNTGKKLPFFLAAATKEKEPDIDLLHIGQKYLDHALDRFKYNVEMFDAIKKGIVEPERCGKCNYCKSTKVLTEPIEADEFYLL